MAEGNECARYIQLLPFLQSRFEIGCIRREIFCIDIVASDFSNGVERVKLRYFRGEGLPPVVFLVRSSRFDLPSLHNPS